MNNMEKNIILFIGEGDNTEKQIADNLKKIFFTDKNIKFYAYGTEIYTLYKKLMEYDFNTNIVDLLIESEKDINKKSELIKIKNGISRIYLFFDYDGHAQANKAEWYSDNTIKEMLEYFKNETDEGKLYISYPMIEAVKDFKRIDNCNRRCKVSAKTNIDYKKLVGDISDFTAISKLIKRYWLAISRHSAKKSKCIINCKCDYAFFENYKEYQKNCSQENIFEQQIINYTNESTIWVVSAFPFFLIDYFGEKLYIKVTAEDDFAETLKIESYNCP